MRPIVTAAVALASLLARTEAGAAATLLVGPGRPFAMPSAAIAAAQAGDTISVAPGVYFDCAIVAKPRLTIAGEGDGVVMTDKTCQGKAILVIPGADITIRNLTLARARVPDRNGAGIRAEGVNLTIDHVAFVDNEDGILAADVAGSAIRISDSSFLRNGRCYDLCAHALYIGHVALLRVERSKFSETRDGHHIKSRAGRTELVDNDIADGPTGTATFAVDLAEGGDLLMVGNRIEKGPKSSTDRAAIMIGAERRGPSDATEIIKSNTFVNDSGHDMAFVMNWGAASPVVTDNVLPPGTTALTTRGAWQHRVHSALYDVKVFVLGLLSLAKRAAHKLIALV